MHRFYFLFLVALLANSCSKQQESIPDQEIIISEKSKLMVNDIPLESDEEGSSRSSNIDVVLIFGGSNSLGIDPPPANLLSNPDVEYSYLFLKSANAVVNSSSRFEVTKKVAYNQHLGPIEYTNTNNVTKKYSGIEYSLARHWEKDNEGKLAIVKVSSFGSGIRNAFDPDKVNHYRYMRGFLNQVFNKLISKGYNPSLKLVVHVSSANDMNGILNSAVEQNYREGLHRLMSRIESRWGNQTKFMVTRMNYIAQANQPNRNAEKAKLHQIIRDMASSKSNLYYANAQDLPLINNDKVHLTYASQVRLGSRVYHASKPFP